MNTICLFGSDFDSPASLHAALKNLLSLPDYYGGNADALSDCLSDLPACPGLWYRADGGDGVNAELALLARVFRDQGGEVKELK